MGICEMCFQDVAVTTVEGTSMCTFCSEQFKYEAAEKALKYAPGSGEYNDMMFGCDSDFGG